MKYYTLTIQDRSTTTHTTWDVPIHDHKVGAIRQYRIFTNSGLRTSKEEIEKVLEGETIYMEDHRAERSGPCEFTSISEIMIQFRDIGFDMEGPFDSNAIDQSIRDIIKQCIDESEFDRAIDLINVIK